MPTTLNPYLSFNDEARDAMDHYQSVFGGELTRTTFGEAGMGEEMGIEPAEKDKVMHSQLVTPGGMVLMGADTPTKMGEQTPGGPISISLSGTEDAELRGYFEKLSASGEVIQPLEKAPWGDSFGMCKDRYGVTWMVNIGSSPT